MPFDDKNPWSPWVSLYYPSTFAHPDAPAGGTGAGYSRPPGPSGTDIHGGRGAPDPHSPEGHKITPWEAAAEYAKFELERAKNGICDAGSWESLCRVAERALGPQSFGLGACYGILKNPTMSVVGLVQLQKMLIEADLYDRLNRRVSWKTLLSPGWMTGLPQLYEVGFHLARYAGVISMDDLKRSYEMREALIKNVGDIFAHPVDSLGNMAGKIKDDYAKKWNRFLELQKQTDLKSQFEAGELFGDVLMEVVMLVLTVISVAGAAAKLAAKVPQLVRIAEFVKGARAVEAGGAAEEAAGVAKGAEAAVEVAKTTSRVATKPNEAFFWSGNTNGVGGEKVAAEIAAKNNGVTLETLISERGIEMPPFDRTNPSSVKAWEGISTEYANGVSGEVRAVVGKQLRAGNIWENKELPALMNNPNVSKITVIDPATGNASVIFSR